VTRGGALALGVRFQPVDRTQYRQCTMVSSEERQSTISARCSTEGWMIGTHVGVAVTDPKGNLPCPACSTDVCSANRPSRLSFQFLATSLTGVVGRRQKQSRGVSRSRPRGCRSLSLISSLTSCTTTHGSCRENLPVIYACLCPTLYFLLPPLHTSGCFYWHLQPCGVPSTRKTIS
jgi:hypothetical protein